MNHIGTQTITTERLILRRFKPNDCKSVYENWAGDEQLQNDYGEPVYDSIEATTNLLMRYISKYEELESYRWGVFLKEDTNNCIGMVSFFLVDTKNQFCEIEYCIGKTFQNKGFITESVKAITAYAFEKVGFNRVQVSCRSVNKPSKRVIEKCGFFTYEGTFRQMLNHLGEYQDRMFYSVLLDEWNALSRKN